MDNELENRLQNVDETTITNNYKNNNIYINSNKNNNNKMSFINNYINSKNLLKSTHQKQHQHHHNYNFKNKNHYTILQILLITFLIVMLRTTTINCLPVTSKPIENTPEHLAWEAWIMLPPPTNPERHRKIMPKSIFVLPTNINNNSKDNNQLPIPQPQIQCPPGYRVDNSKCIPIISINRDQLLIDQLTNLLPVSMKPDDSSYDDYDYDYTNSDTYNHDLDMLQSYQKQSLPPLINNNPNIFRDSEKNSEPLKINLSLDKFLIGTKDDKKNNNSQYYDIKNDSSEFILELNNENSNEEIKLRPFRDQEASSSHIELSTAILDEKNKTDTSIEIDTIETETKTKNNNDSESILQQQQQYSTVFGNKESTTITATSIGNTEKSSESNDSSAYPNTTEFDKESQTESKRESIDSTDVTSTENTNNIQQNNNDDTSANPNESIDVLELSNTDKNSDIFISTLPTTDSTTMVSILSSDEIEMSAIVDEEFNSTTTPDYEYDQMTTLNKNDNTQQLYKDKNFEIVTEQIDKEKNFEEKLSEESLVLDKSIEENSTESSSEISLQDDIITNSPLYEDISSESVDQSSPAVSNKIEKSTTDSVVRAISTTKTIEQKSETTVKNEMNSNSEHKIVHVNHHRNHNNHHSIPHSTVRISASQPIEWHEDREPLMESIESNNRFVYHHLGSSSAPQADLKFSSNQPLTTTTNNQPSSNLNIFATPESTTQPKRDSETDIKEQLRIINMIVEENKRRAQTIKVRFPDSEISTLSSLQKLRSQTQVHFPTESQQQQQQQDSTPYQTSTSYYQTQSGRFDPDKLIFHRRFFQNHQQQQQQQNQQQHQQQQEQHSTTNTPHSSTSTSTQTDTQKPFWWLPSGWEIDQSGDRPMLIRFWSRSPSRNSEQFASNTESYTDKYRTASSNTHHIVTENFQNHSNTQTNSNINSNYNLNTSDGLHSRQQTTTTSRYRENSRSPTDNLYREVPSSQNVYKVLNAARQWKYNNR